MCCAHIVQRTEKVEKESKKSVFTCRMCFVCLAYMWFTIFDSTFCNWVNVVRSDDELSSTHTHTKHYICKCHFTRKTIKIVVIIFSRRLAFATKTATHRLNNHDGSTHIDIQTDLTWCAEHFALIFVAF